MTTGKFSSEVKRQAFQPHLSCHPFGLSSTSRRAMAIPDDLVFSDEGPVSDARIHVLPSKLDFYASTDNRYPRHAIYTNGGSRSRISSLKMTCCEPAKGRAMVQHDYHDHAFRKDAFYAPSLKVDEELTMLKPEFHNKDSRQPLHGHELPWTNDLNATFPEKLYAVLQHAETTDRRLGSIISWQPHGRCFLVHDQVLFVNEVLKRYFRQSKYTSFQRQLNLYGFKRLTKGPDIGAYYHELFLRGRSGLCRRIVRMRIKGNGIKPAPNPAMEPNFYAMKPCFESDGAPLSESIAAKPSFRNKSAQSSRVPQSSPGTIPTIKRNPDFCGEHTSREGLNRSEALSRFATIQDPSSEDLAGNSSCSRMQETHESVGSLLGAIEVANFENFVRRKSIDHEGKVPSSPAVLEFREDEDPLLDADVAAVDPWIMHAYESRFLPVGGSRKGRMKSRGGSRSLYSSTTISSLQLIDDLPLPLDEAEANLIVDEGSLLRLLSTEL